MSLQTPFFNAFVSIGGIAVPAQPGSRVMNPLNDNVPPIIGNTYQWNVGPGLQSPSVDINIALRDVADEAIGPTIMGLAHNRVPIGTNPSFDTSTTTVIYWDGVSGYTITNAKLESYTLSFSKEAPIVLSCRFVASGSSCYTPLGAAPGAFPYEWSNAPFIYGQSLTFSAPFANLPWSASLSYANNHSPNMAFNGSPYPYDMNAGMPTAGFNMRMQAVDTPPADGTPVVMTITGPTVLNTPGIVFTVANPKWQTTPNRGNDVPRVFRDYTCICRGLAGRDNGATNNAPLTVAINGTAVTE